MANELYGANLGTLSEFAWTPTLTPEGLFDKPVAKERSAARKPKSAMAVGEKAGPRVGAGVCAQHPARAAALLLTKEGRLHWTRAAVSAISRISASLLGHRLLHHLLPLDLYPFTACLSGLGRDRGGRAENGKEGLGTLCLGGALHSL